ncbi:hypothetical protein CDL12_27411 [Handroanthus impetiginosus]|uniref:Uncharacterized protein n=1 Tax=Handroanthus impetiginosus TaxID=429701 RepID=A0A2G9G456_9LAMI|nr:hypothetical protein CDL12_27411 [Handroanthus impetiginosus]
MAYYAALVSLKLTIKRLSKSPKVSFLSLRQKILEFAYKEVSSLQQVLQRLEQKLLKNSTREEVIALTGQIRDAACELEDSLEFHVSDQFFSQSESLGGGCPVMLSPDTEEIKQRINYIKEMVENLEKTIQELRNPLPEEDSVTSPSIHFGGEESKMVGFSYPFDDIKFLLAQNYRNQKLKVFSIYGMAGIGKSKVAKEIYKDQLDFKHFECCAWLSKGPEHQLKKVLLHDKLHKEGDEILVEELYTSLSRRKYLIVVDDIWSKQDWDKLRSSLPENNNGSRVCLTTRLEEVAKYAATFCCRFKMQFLDKEKSWDLLQQKVFGEECYCPFQLEKAGRKIAQKCEGLPLTIVTVANILSKSVKTPEYWDKVAEKKNSVFDDAYEQMSKVLFSSYKYLTQHLKAAFLYTGVFPPSSEIRASKLIRLWIAEGFLDQFTWMEGVYYKFLRNLVSSNVVLIAQKGSYNKIKTWKLNSAFRYLCVREARKEKFFHVLETYPNSFNESVEIHQRFCILNNILLGMEEVHNLMKSITTARSLLCTGPEHHYPVPLFTDLKLLRVLDALTIRFYKFPGQVLKLIHLRYLALTYSGNVPTSISKLWNLQFLIVR